MELLTLDQINAAADRLRPVMRLTPVIASRVLSDRTGEQVWLKCENLMGIDQRAVDGVLDLVESG